MIINLSNHPSAQWCEEQLIASKQYGGLVDMPFPSVDAYGDEAYIATLVDDYYNKIISLSAENHVVVHLMGEMTFTYSLVNKLKQQGITCLASCTNRNVIELPGGRKEVSFGFVQFRKY